MLEPARLEISLHGLPHRAPEGAHWVNRVQGGPEQMLQWLESQLGTGGPAEAWTLRVSRFHGLLAGKPGPWSRSFAVDAWGTSAALLRRYDRLRMDGWHGGPAPRGFEDLAALSDVPEGMPARLDRVRQCLEAGLRLPPHTVMLHEPADLWPRLWQQVLAWLTTEAAPDPTPSGAGNLGRLQAALLRGTDETTADAFHHVVAPSPSEAVEWLVRRMREGPVTVVCNDPDLAPRIDLALAADGQPTMGVPASNLGQPAHQVLHLVLGLLREPVNPWILLDFLALPVGPMGRYGLRLARALEDQPGFESDAWFAKADEIAEEDPSIRDRIAAWFEHDRFPAGVPLPTALVEQRCGAVSAWARSLADYHRGKGSDDVADSLEAASSQAAAVGSLAAGLGSTITEAQLEKLVVEVQQEGAQHVPRPAEAGGSVFVSDLAHVRPTEHLIWFSVGADRPALTNPSDERALAEAGLGTPPHHLSRSLRWAQIKGLASASRLTAIEILDDAPRHPLWLQIQALSEVKTGRLTRLSATGIPTCEIAVEKHEGPRLQWDLEQMPKEERTSASAIEHRLACPLKWTLREGLRMRPSSITAVPEDFRLKGLLAHAVMEKVFPPGPPPAPDAAAAAAKREFREQLPRNAAPLAIARKKGEALRLERQLVAAAREFAKILADGGYEVVGMEMAVEGSIDEIPLVGSIDCVIQNDRGPAIVDFKMAGAGKYRKVIEQGRAVQLAVYHHGRPMDDVPQAGAYFVLDKAHLITPTGGALDGVRAPVEGRSIEATWNSVARALGPIGVVPTPLLPEEDWGPAGLVLEPGKEADKQATCRYCDYGVLCGRRRLL